MNDEPISSMQFDRSLVRTYQDQITKLLHLHTRLERELKLATLDNDIREIKQVNLKGI